MYNIKWLNLQLFADGGEGGGEGGAESGADAAAAGQSRLRELGVPESKIRAKTSRKVGEMTAAEAKPQTKTEAEDVNAEKHEEPEKEGSQAEPKKTFKELMEDPDYNREMQATIQARLRTAKKAEEDMGKLAPAIELLARKYGLDATNLDYDALTKAINDDNDYYEEKALEMGVSVETAKKLDQDEREAARIKAEQKRTLEQQRIEEHFRKLETQGNELKKTFKNFDLMKELQNPVFARMTSPGVGLSVEDAYYAVHRKEIQTAAMQIATQKTAQQMSAAIQAGQRRPSENGTSSQAPSVTTFNYKNATREQREDFKRRLRERMARGEKVYPGQI